MIAGLRFGRTGHQSTRTVFGGAAVVEGSSEKADRCLGLLLQYGVTHWHSRRLRGSRVVDWPLDRAASKAVLPCDEDLRETQEERKD